VGTGNIVGKERVGKRGVKVIKKKTVGWRVRIERGKVS